MCKKFLLIFILALAVQQTCLAKSVSSSQINSAINKYKTGNYTGCMQDMEYLQKQDPSNPVIYYYLGMAYTQMGNKDKAISSYKKVLTLKPNSTLETYAEQGARCLETPDKCKKDDGKNNMTDLDKFIAQPFGDGLSPKVRNEIEGKRLEALQKEINQEGADVNEMDMRNFKDYSKQKYLNFNNDKKPTNEEIVAALKVLERAGFSGLVKNDATASAVNPQNTVPASTQIQKTNENQNKEDFSKIMSDPNIMAQQQQLQQLQMMMGNNNNNNNNYNNNMMMNMLPYMMAKSGNGSMSKEMLQTMMMNSMMPNLDFYDNNNNNNR